MPAPKSWFSETNISTRLTFAFSTLLALLVLLTAIGIYQVNQIDRGLTSINDVNGAKQRFAVDMRGSVHDRAIALRDIVMTTDASRLTTLNEEMRRLAANYDTAIESMQQVMGETDTTPQEQSILSTINNQSETTQALTQQVLDANTANALSRAQTLTLEQAGPAYAEWLNRINQFINLQEQINNASTAAARSTASGFQLQMLGLTLFAVLIGGAIAIFLTRQLLRELGAEPRQVKVFAEAIGRGELTTQPYLKKGDTSSIMASQVAMSKQLQAIVAQVRSSAEAVASNSEQIAEGNNDLSSRTEEQASALAETASAMEQLNSTVKLNADNSQQASQEAASASTTAIQGGEAVHQVVATMNDLNKSSQEIAGIISTIDAIAFQTNILALNASVEAARAGEHGRGVRKLAQRSADAAREINDLISNNLERVNHGNTRAEEASKSTEDIVAAIERVTKIMQEISHASAEQSTGVQEVGQAITEMDQVTQQNAALVEESANAANHLRQNAHQLLHAMSVFKLPASQQHAHAQTVTSTRQTQNPATNNAPSLTALKRQPAESAWDSF